MVITEEIRQMILRRSSAVEISRVAEREGMVRLRDDGLLKAAFPGRSDGRRSIKIALRPEFGRVVGFLGYIEPWYISNTDFVDSRRRVTS